MTALCPGGGTSGPKPGVLTGIVFDATSVGAFVTAAGFPELDAPIAVIAAGVALTVDVFCGTDPPADPGITQNDIIEVNNPTSPQSWATAAGRVKDWFLHNYWFQVCECQGAATPPPPVVVLPHGTGTNTGLPTGSATTPCWNVNVHTTAPAFVSGAFGPSKDLTAQVLPSIAPTLAGHSPAPDGAATVLQSFPTGATQVNLSISVNPPMEGGAECIAGIQWTDGSGVALQGIQATINPGQSSATSVVGFPANTARFWQAFVYQTFGVQKDLTVSVNFLCSGQSPTALAVPCCPPDPLVQQYLQVILNIVSNLYTTPAGTPSSGWADAAVHSALSGTGSFQLGRNVTGIRANFTTIPPTIRTTPGTPTFYWDLGFVTPVAMVVPLRSLRTVFATQAMPLPAQTTAIDYTFPQGAVVTLTELIPA